MLLPFQGVLSITLQLLLTDEDIDWTTMQRPVLTDLVLQEAAIVLLYILWQVGIEHKRWNRSIRQLCTVLDLDILTLTLCGG